MLGEGMPWHIIIVFFIIGALMGVKSGKDDDKLAAEAKAKQEKISKEG